MRSLLVWVSLGLIALLVGCGGGTPSGVGLLTVSLTPSTAQTIDQGATLPILATVSNDSTNSGVSWSLAGVGRLSNATTTSVTYIAPATVNSDQTVTVTALAIADSSVSASLKITVKASAVTVTLSPVKPQNLAEDQTLAISAATEGDSKNSGVTWTLSPGSGAGSLSGATSTSVTYHSPASVSRNLIATVIATSKADSSSSSQLVINVLANGKSNVQPISVNGGPVGNYADAAMTSVTLCVPGTSQCQTIDGILVDTGSVGLRVLASAINLPLRPFTTNGGTLNNCVSFVDGSFLWGEVEPADVYMAGESAGQTPVHVLADPTSFSIPDSCSNGGVDEDNQAGLEANGILGVGTEPTDCTLKGVNYCDGSQGSVAEVYYACTSSGCSVATVKPSEQVSNPIALFAENGMTSATDNNGVILQFPTLAGAAPTLGGSMTFGITTESNNGLGAAQVFTLDGDDNFITTYKGQAMTASFIDSGSNGFFFPDGSITQCSNAQGFYCPSSTLNLSAVNKGQNGVQNTVNFSVANAESLFQTGDFAYGDLGGPNPCSSTCSFDWGLPFFFGRSVFTSIDGQAVTGAAATPWWAY